MPFFFLKRIMTLLIVFDIWIALIFAYMGGLTHTPPFQETNQFTLGYICIFVYTFTVTRLISKNIRFMLSHNPLGLRARQFTPLDMFMLNIFKFIACFAAILVTELVQAPIIEQIIRGIYSYILIPGNYLFMALCFVFFALTAGDFSRDPYVSLI